MTLPATLPHVDPETVFCDAATPRELESGADPEAAIRNALRRLLYFATSTVDGRQGLRRAVATWDGLQPTLRALADEPEVRPLCSRLFTLLGDERMAIEPRVDGLVERRDGFVVLALTLALLAKLGGGLDADRAWLQRFEHRGPAQTE